MMFFLSLIFAILIKFIGNNNNSKKRWRKNDTQKW